MALSTLRRGQQRSKSTKGKRHKIHFDMIYNCHLSTHEIEPMIGVSCSLVKKPKMGYDTANVAWASTKAGSPSAARGDAEEFLQKSEPMRVSIKFDGNLPWPRDAAIWFQVFAKVKSSEGKLRFEKAGAGVLHLANLVPEFVTAHHAHIHKGGGGGGGGGSHQGGTRGHKHHPISIQQHESNDKMMIVEVPLTLQSMRIMKEEPIMKGKLTIRASKLPAKNFRPASKFDLVPGNMKFVESSMMALVKKNLAVFDPDVNEKLFGKGCFDPVADEIQRVHAPLFITAQGVLPGEYYWANLAGEVDYDESVYLSVAKTVLERHRIGEEWFIKKGVPDTARSSPKVVSFDSRTHGKAAILFGEMTAAMATTLAYIADYADLNDDRRNRYSFSKQKSHITVESFDDAMMRHADDCEGLARLNARVFMGFRDGKFRDPLLQAVQTIANMYVGAGTLGSVTSAQISGADRGGGVVKIGSDVDLSAEIGAHMWFSLIPKRHFLMMVARTSRSTRDKIVWGDGSTIASRPIFESDYPVMISEGTGMLHPAPLAPDAYHKGFKDKVEAVNEDLIDREAYARLMTDSTLLSLKNGSARPDPPGELGRLQIMRTQSQIVSDPDARVSSFYRVWSAMFPVLEARDDVRWQEKTATGLLPASWSGETISDDFEQHINTGDSKAPVYSWRYLVPVQISPRPDVYPGEVKDLEAMDHSAPLQWGAQTSDMLHKRPYVGLIRMGAATSEQEKIISSYARHLPPQALIKAPTSGQLNDFGKRIKVYNDIIRREAFGGGNALTDKEFFSRKGNSLTTVSEKHGMLHIAKGFIKFEDSTTPQIRAIADRLRTCPFAVDARIVGEMFDPRLTNIRLEVMISMTEPAQLDITDKSFTFPFDGQA